MEPIPDHCKDIADHAADEKRYDHKRCRGAEIERPDSQLQMDHVRPKNEVIERLRPIQRNQERPDHLSAPEKDSDRERGFR